jgi:hypothetical protein
MFWVLGLNETFEFINYLSKSKGNGNDAMLWVTGLYVWMQSTPTGGLATLLVYKGGYAGMANNLRTMRYVQ